MMRTKLLTFLLLVCFAAAPAAIAAGERSTETSSANKPADAGWAESYREVANQLIEAALDPENVDFMWERLAWLTDYYPHRLSGSEMLEKAINWMYGQLNEDGFDRVYKQEVMVPHWVRGRESLTFHGPWERELRMLGLGSSVGTPAEGIRAEILVVQSFEELHERAAEARGKIVVWNVPFTTYGETVQYRVRGASEASRVGAVASLLRSVAPFSMQTPHTGNIRYDEDVEPIPFAAITLEDAELMQRFQNRGERMEVTLKMEAQMLPDALSHNIIAELRGSEKPEEIVVIGGHIDSWDVGHGVMDDAGGVIASWEAMRLMKALGLQPRRTIRLVGWTNEENGVRGGLAYRDMVMEDGSFRNHQLAFEIDFGVFAPLGFGFTGTEEAFAMLEPIMKLTAPTGAEILRRSSSGTVDIGPLMREGMPGMGIDTDVEKYFWYHHTDSDTLDKQNPEDIARVIAATAVMIYVVADMEARLPWAE